ncbi:5,6-dimethylbenzimidazole synthase [Frigidibacter sp. MR17.14]|uniref:5,6-dimethylbenzimidazole synthase n=1 Tax=Frigidibacter sp. MR17.14 TaxID=3126509 RepID=UPI003FA5BCC4
MTGPAPFAPDFVEELHRLFHWRRDVRRFRTDPVPDEAFARALTAFAGAPSVGLSEPWRVIRVDSAGAKAAALANFEAANAEALARQQPDAADLYARLKLAGLREAPVHLAVWCDEGTTKGRGLGAGTMPETRAYSVVCAITCLWLALRAEGLGLGWVSILDPERLRADLKVPDGWRFIGYLCIGFPEAEEDRPELEKLGWETRRGLPAIETR